MGNEVKAIKCKTSILDRIRWKWYIIKWFFERNIVKFSLWLIRKSQGSGCSKHALSEFEFVGWNKPDPETGKPCKMQACVCSNVLDLLAVFSSQGHSGSSAPYVANLFKTLAAFEPIGPIKGTDDEWQETFGDDDMLQNKRCSHVFKKGDGRAFDTNGKVFREPSGCCYTSGDSRVYIEFPYVPKTEYVDVEAAE